MMEMERASPQGNPVPGPEGEAETREALGVYFETLRRKRRETGLFGLAVLAAFAVFALSTWTSARANFTKDRVRASALRTAEALAREGSPMLLEALREAAPAYRAEAARALREAAPALAAKAEGELRAMSEHLSRKAAETLERAAVAPVESTVRDLAESFPALADESFVGEMVEEFESSVRTETGRLFAEVDAHYRPPAEGLLRAAEELAQGQATGGPADFMRQFLHLWVVLLDMELGGRGSLPAETGGRTPRVGTERG